jgi:tetraacyldisaccharide 4'-kinase
VNPLSHLYGSLASRRRRYYTTRPEIRRRLRQPVVSVGNLSLGGSGKTPLVEHLARLLVDAGLRPAILTRGYGRADAADGAVVVSDGHRLLADLGRAGDEPLMLARNLPRASVVVCADRYLAGTIAERRLGCDVHLLDDGFQHLALHRSVDLLILGEDDLALPVPLPAGRLREPLAAAAVADAVLWSGHTRAPDELRSELGLREVFSLLRRPGAIETQPFGEGPVPAGARVLAVAAIARPGPFVEELRQSGFDVAGEMTWRDHHRFTRADIERIRASTAASGALGIVTTEKDMVRLLPLRPLPFAVAWRPLHVRVEPHDRFVSWLLARLAEDPAERLREPTEPAA